MTVRLASAKLAISPGLGASLLEPVRHVSSVATAGARLTVAAPTKDKRGAAAIGVDAEITASATHLPNSQSVFLTFQLDRTLVPYTAERG